VAGYDFFWVADGCEVDAGVPAEEYIDVRRYVLELGRGEDSRFLAGPSARLGMTIVWDWSQERFEQFGDAGGVHELSIVDRAERFGIFRSLLARQESFNTEGTGDTEEDTGLSGTRCRRRPVCCRHIAGGGARATLAGCLKAWVSTSGWAGGKVITPVGNPAKSLAAE